uniref:Zinc finger piccolo-type domain-containing protein n=1 Tax=Leptobrachium leishanense TaxID=445787 RepID=A0A8C5QC90_9ANUR
MQRALGMDMTTAPRSKSQQQLHSPSLSPSHSPAKQTNAQAPAQSFPKLSQSQEQMNQGYTKPAAPPDVVRSSPQHSQAKPSPGEQRKTLGSSPAKTPAPSAHGIQDQAQEGLTGKLFGFGASLLNQASTLISVPAETVPQSQSSPGKASPKIIFSDASKEGGTKPQDAASIVPSRVESSPVHKHGKVEPVKPKEVPKVLCPLCKTELKVDSSQPSNYNTCTSCKKQVCNMCGFNPTPHLVEVRMHLLNIHLLSIHFLWREKKSLFDGRSGKLHTSCDKILKNIVYYYPAGCAYVMYLKYKWILLDFGPIPKLSHYYMILGYSSCNIHQ